MNIDNIKEVNILNYINNAILTLNCNSNEDNINNICTALSNVANNSTKNNLFDLLLKKIVIVRADQFTMMTLITNEINKLSSLDNVEYVNSCIKNITNEKARKMLEDLLLNKKTTLELQNKPKSKHLNLSEMFKNKQKNNK